MARTPLSASDYLRAISDAFTPVRDETGRLLGCVPRVRDDVDALSYAGQAFDLRLAAQVCLCVNLGAGQRPQVLEGFVPLPDINIDLATPIAEEDAGQPL